MTDDEFLAAFAACTLGSFHHRDHLRLTFLSVTRKGETEAVDDIRVGIQHFATHHGQAAKYHDTMTRFWVRLVAHMVAYRPDVTSFDAFLDAFPMVLDTSLPTRHWSEANLFSPLARAQWVEPDLLAMPA